MARNSKKNPEVTVIVLAQDCLSQTGAYLTPEECEAIAAVFTAGAAAIREGKHGTIACLHEDEILAQVDIDNGGPFDEDEGFPILQEITVQKARAKVGKSKEART